MKIMIIGSSGMAGPAITKLALERNHTVVAIGRPEEKLAALPVNPNLQTKAKYVFDPTLS